MTIWCTYSSRVCRPCTQDHTTSGWAEFCRQKHHPTLNEKTQKETHRSLLNDFLMFWCFSPFQEPLPHLVFSQWLPAAFGLRYGTGQYVCVRCFCLFVSELWENGSCKGGGQNTGSHLCLQVHDLLAHQGNGGTGFLPLHRLHLQRGCCHGLQVLPHPGRWGMGLSYALPRSLTWCLRLVLKRKRTEGKCLVLGEAHKLYAEFCWWAFFISSTILHVCLRNEVKKILFLQSFVILWPMFSM